MSRTELGRLFQSANSLDILVYVHEHPGCFKSDVYRDVTRNAHTREKIDMMENIGLLEITPYAGKGRIMNLTDKGKRLFDLLIEAEAVLREPSTIRPEISFKAEADCFHSNNPGCKSVPSSESAQ